MMIIIVINDMILASRSFNLSESPCPSLARRRSVTMTVTVTGGSTVGPPRRSESVLRVTAEWSPGRETLTVCGFCRWYLSESARDLPRPGPPGNY